MKLRARIRAKYLDEIIAGKKTCEYRQIESMELTDEKGRVKTFIVNNITYASLDDVRYAYPDVPWVEDEPVYKIGLGEEVKP